MKKLLSIIVCLILIPILLLGGGLAAIYFTYFNPQPADYAFLCPQDQIESIEFAVVSFADGNISAKGVGYIDDIDGFMEDLAKLECHEGIPIESIFALAEMESIEGIIINYADGSYEIITPYASLNSKLEINDIGDLIEMKIYGYGVEEFNEMLKLYKENYLEL